MRNWSFGQRKKVAIGFLAFILTAGFVVAFMYSPDEGIAYSFLPNDRGGLHRKSSLPLSKSAYLKSYRVGFETSPGNEDYLQVLPDWEQVNSNGFGDPQASEVSALETFNGQLYAGTNNPTNLARIFRSSDGVMWTPVIEPGFGISHDIAPPAILDLVVFNGRIYASTGRGDGPGQIWRSLDGVNWAPMVIHGFGDPDVVDITALTEYNGLIYAGATDLITGAQIWRSYTGDNNTWVQVAPTVPGTAAASVTGFAEFDGGLYAAIESDSPAQIWRSYGGNWAPAISDGFGNSFTTSTGGMTVFGSYLYVGAGNTEDGALLFRTNDGDNWESVITPGFGDSNNKKVEMVFILHNYLYASVKNSATGIEIWQSTDGISWEQVNQDGFGDLNNTGSNWNNAKAAFMNQLYVGTSNVIDGGEIWRMQQLFAVDLSPDNSLDGPAGRTINYTLKITNTGTMTDTFDLTTEGNSWVTAISSPSISLDPGVQNTFTVTVTIPENALAGATDTVAVTATSESDNGVKDTAVLTTRCSDLVSMVYLPVILRFR